VGGACAILWREIKTYLKQISYVFVSGTDIPGSGYGEITCCCEHGNEPPVSIKHGKFLDYFRNYRLLKREFTALIS
jgi:hypothetical protein